MPELPEIYNLAAQMNDELTGKAIADIEVRQDKCLNVPVDEFKGLALGKRISAVTSRGKWVFICLDTDAHMLLNLGMGGDALYHKNGDALPEKYQFKITFDDGSLLTIRFWWFGYVHAVTSGGLSSHKMTAKLGLSPVDDTEFTYENYEMVMKGKKGSLKSLLMNQECFAGIGNVYAQDILFMARLHPDRKVNSLSDTEKKALYDAIRNNLKEMVKLGGLAFEKDLYGNGGRFKDFLVGYKEGKPCPECGTTIEKIKTGSTSTYICPNCQR